MKYILLLFLTSCATPTTIYKKEKLSDTYTVYYFGDYKFFSDSTLYEPGDTVKDLHERCYKVK